MTISIMIHLVSPKVIPLKDLRGTLHNWRALQRALFGAMLMICGVDLMPLEMLVRLAIEISIKPMKLMLIWVYLLGIAVINR